MIRTPPAPIRLALTFKEFYTDTYPCSRARANGYVQTGELETFVDRGRRMVLLDKAREFVASRAAKGGAVTAEVSAMKSAAGRKGVEAQRALRAEGEATN